MEHRLFLYPGYTLQCIKTAKFKTFSIALRFASAFLPEAINNRALLPNVLLGGTKKYPSKALLQTQMDALYGLTLNVGTEKIGTESVIYFEMKFVNEKYLPNQGMALAEALDLLAEIIYNPRQIKNLFCQQIVDEEIRLLKEDFEAEYINKSEYAYNQFMKTMFKTELHQYRAKGIYETLDEVTLVSLKNSYLQMLHNDNVTIICVGDFEYATMDALIAKRFSFDSPIHQESWLDRETKDIVNATVVTEDSDVSQARINQGYRFPVRFGDQDYYAGVVLNAIFGEFDHSQLFQIVREENTLCYYISSSYDSNKGVIIMMAGVDPGNEEQTLALIDTIVKGLKTGALADEEITIAKESLIQRIRQNADSPERLAHLFFLYRKTLGKEFDPNQTLAAIAAVNKQDIITVAQKLTLDTTYILTKKVQ
ncbi:MAG: pitrilysin family protein [Candidatus Izemoplasmatales bacterium]|jgi:predicted Zn-dependent peptidase|nr:pitrilysin family protein [Candidatus Izemoplasmatales bacterium]